MTSAPTAPRIRAAELTGCGWLNTGGESLTLAGLRGKFVLLDFWTFCCINCLHVLGELRELQERYRDVLVIVGVHSPKFAHEADPDALAAAVQRYDVDHPVLDDPGLTTWDAYAARAWPTLTLIDPNGYVVAQMSGEGHAHGIDVLLRELIGRHEADGTLRRGDGPYVPPDRATSALRFPGKIAGLASGGFLVSDTAHHQIVELEGDLVTERRRYGSGRRGLVDGPAARAAFAEPQGILVLPADLAAKVGYEVLVADTANHALRGLDPAGGTVRTVAGTGRQLRERGGAGPALAQDLSSPWDVALHGGAVVVAMAGTHQLWRFDPESGTVSVLAGTSAEGLLDGPADDAHFAQPSGLAVDAAGTLWIADSETSALRRLTPAPDDAHRSGSGYAVRTEVGKGLFDFGHVDGPADTALMQHPLGLAVLPDGSIAVCDTYNGAIRRFDPTSREMSTLATGFDEPSDVVVDVSGPEPTLVVVESGAHRLERIVIPRTAQRVAGRAEQVTRSPMTINAAGVALRIDFRPPTGQKLDDRFGDPTQLTITSSPVSLLRSGSGTGPGLTRTLVFAGGSGGEPAGGSAGVLHISVQAAACDGDPVTGEVPEFAACHLYQQDWGIPVTLDPSGPAEIRLPLRAV